MPQCLPAPGSENLGPCSPGTNLTRELPQALTAFGRLLSWPVSLLPAEPWHSRSVLGQRLGGLRRTTEGQSVGLGCFFFFFHLLMSQPKAVLAELLHIKLPFSNWEEGGCDLRRSDSSCQWTPGLTLLPGGERARRARRPGVSTPRETSLRTATSLSWGQEPPFGAPRHGTPIPGLSLPVL